MWSAEIRCLLAQDTEELIETFLEGGYTLVFELLSHLAHVDAERREMINRQTSVIDTCVYRPSNGAMLVERLEGVVREGVDRVGSDEFVDIERVGVRRVLGRSRSP